MLARALVSGLAFLLLAPAALPQALRAADRPPVRMAAGDEAAFEALIADFEAFQMRVHPELAARERGEPVRHWPDMREAALTARAAEAKTLADRLAGLETRRAVDAAILGHLLDEELMRARHDLWRIPFTGDSGFHSSPLFAASRLRLRTREEADAWTARLEALPAFFDQHIVHMRRGIATGWTAHADPLATTLDQVAQQIVDDPLASDLYAPYRDLPDHWPPDARADIRAAGHAAVAGAVEAYRALHAFLEAEYAPAARRDAGLASLEGGRAAYRDLADHHTAGAGYGPQEIHRIGLEEVERIRAEMDAILVETGFDGSHADFIAYLRSDPRFYAASPDDLMEKAAEMSKRLDAMLPRYFSALPRLPYGIARVPPAIAPGFTTGRYMQGDFAAGRAGTFLVNTYRLDQRPLYELPALAAHEAVPGHHLQIALAQEMEGTASFRRRFYATAFGEGWALYAERLAGEAGIYRTPYERFGALSYEMWRACRLVADTGLHWYGWTRDQARACFAENTALSKHNIKTELTRYIGWPGQALGYKIGELLIMDLRAEAEAALGADFDIRGFHDHLLGAGSMPLSVMKARMRRWIEDQQAARGEMVPPAP